MPVVAFTEELKTLDFSKLALAIGIEVPGGSRDWMELSAEEFRVLALLIRKPLVADGESAASYHPMLKLFADWCEAAADYAEKTKKPKVHA